MNISRSYGNFPNIAEVIDSRNTKARRIHPAVDGINSKSTNCQRKDRIIDVRGTKVIVIKVFITSARRIMPSQGPPFFYADYYQRRPLMDNRFPHHPQGPAFPPNIHIMAPPFDNQFQFRPPMWGPPGHNYQNNAGPYNYHWHHNHNRNLQPVQGNSDNNDGAQGTEAEEEKTCCICHDVLQNSEEHGVHLCDGGVKKEEKPEEASKTDLTVEIQDMDARLEKLLDELKVCLRNKYESVTETLENYVTSRITEIGVIHKEVLEEKSHLESLQTELQTRTQALEEREKVLRDKEGQLHKDREKFEEELYKEKQEICRQWQALTDEITRQEKLHEVQKVYWLLKHSHPVFDTG